MLKGSTFVFLILILAGVFSMASAMDYKDYWDSTMVTTVLPKDTVAGLVVFAYAPDGINNDTMKAAQMMRMAHPTLWSEQALMPSASWGRAKSP